MSTPVRPSRRTVVRSAAWSAPAVAVAVEAPAAYAASPAGQLILSLGDTVITADNQANYAVRLQNASVTVSGKNLPPGSLTFTIDFVAAAGTTTHLMVRTGDIPTWSNTQPDVPQFALLFTYPLGAAAGATIPLDSQGFVGRVDGDLASTTGRLRFIVSAPGFGTSVAVRPVPPPILTITPTSTPLTVAGILPHRTYGISLDGFAVTPLNAAVLSDQLSVHCLFKPAAGFDSTQLTVTPGTTTLTGFAAQQTADQPVADAAWLRQTGSAAGQAIALSETPSASPLVTTSGTEATQRGTFLVRAQAPGFPTAEFESPAFPPPPGDLVFDPGSSVVRQDAFSGQWGLRFSGASLTLPEPVEGGYITMTVTYAPTLGPDTLQYGAAAPAGWSLPAGVPFLSTASRLTYTLQPTSTGKVPIQDGMFFTQALAPSAQRGMMTLTFAGPQLNPATYNVAITGKPYLEVLDPEAISLTRLGTDQWALGWSAHTLQATGAAPPPADTLTLTVERVDSVSGSTLQTFVRSVDTWTPAVTTPVLFDTKTFTYPGGANTWTAPPAGQGGTLTIGPALGSLTYVTGSFGQTGAMRITYQAPGFVPAVVQRPLP